MMPIVFINCDSYPFVSLIIDGLKAYETRNRNTLKSLVGQVVYIAETSRNHKPVVKCKALIESVTIVSDLAAYNSYRNQTKVEKGSKYDFVPKKKKYLYKLTNTQPVPNFTPVEGKRHGFTWMEYTT